MRARGLLRRPHKIYLTMLNKQWRENGINDEQEGMVVENEVGPDLDDVLIALSRLEDKMESLTVTIKQAQLSEPAPLPSLPTFQE